MNARKEGNSVFVDEIADIRTLKTFDMDLYNNVMSRAGKMVKRWWLLLMLGLLIMAAGIVVFCFPAESYMTLSVIFGVLMLVSGISELVVSLGSRNFFMMRGYSVVGAVLDLLLGIFLCCFPGVTLVVLPVVLGIWLLYHSFMIIGFGGDLSTFRLGGSGWVIAGGALLMVFSLLMLIMPLTVGMAAITLVTGLAFLFAGALIVALSLQLKRMHENVRNRYPGPDYGD